jgi:polysaccharide deacetylase family protein (PEP-CTERM system associated)
MVQQRRAAGRTDRVDAPVLNALSFDVEDYFQVAALSGAVDRSAWERMPSRVADNTGRLLDLLAEHRVKATFFVLGWVAERHPAIVRRIAAAGHEVACHGYSHQPVYLQAPAEFRDETRRAKVLLEDQSQQRVRGYRAATWSITRKSLWALDILAEEGFDYDSSIFPIRHDLYGIPGARRSPYRLGVSGGRTLLEFPPSTVKIGPVTLPVAGGGYFRLLPLAVTQWAIRRVNAEGLPFMFYLHPWEIDPDQPRMRVGLKSRLRHYTNLSASKPRLKALLGEFEMGPVRDVLTAQGSLEDAPQVEAQALLRAGSL